MFLPIIAYGHPKMVCPPLFRPKLTLPISSLFLYKCDEAVGRRISNYSPGTIYKKTPAGDINDRLF
jgi:hypothetical protein